MKIALLQLNSGDEPAENLNALQVSLQDALQQRADVIVTPEVTNCVSTKRARQAAVLFAEDDDPTLTFAKSFAFEHKVWLILGSLALKQSPPELLFVNRQFIIDPDGKIESFYDKIHMFDVILSESEAYRESDGYAPGSRLVTTKIDDFTFGSSICYDLRFPHLYRDLALAGSDVLLVPSAFSVPTGEAHWHTLLRARAIETGAYVIAPAQTGEHPGRRTYGHSLVVDPWGTVVLDAGTETGVHCVTLNIQEVLKARQKIPSLQGTRPYTQAS
ncbi:MAG: carbon-nitrogen hydrolase family protein [Pseudomonadota bacterium]